MSQKDFLEKKEFEIKTRRTVCDLCGETVKEGTVRLRIDTECEKPSTAEFGPSRGYYVSEQVIDVCSAECLKSNVNGITLLLQSKIVPNTDKKSDAIAKASYPGEKEASPKQGLASSIASVFKLNRPY